MEIVAATMFAGSRQIQCLSSRGSLLLAGPEVVASSATLEAATGQSVARSASRPGAEACELVR